MRTDAGRSIEACKRYFAWDRQIWSQGVGGLGWGFLGGKKTNLQVETAME